MGEMLPKDTDNLWDQMQFLPIKLGTEPVKIKNDPIDNSINGSIGMV